MSTEAQTPHPDSVPRIVVEDMQARNERREFRYWITILLLIAFIFIENAVWIFAWNWYWSQYDFIEETISVDSKDGGNANYTSGGGNIYNGYDSQKIAETDPEGP